jgi:hypothetical protein
MALMDNSVGEEGVYRERINETLTQGYPLKVFMYNLKFSFR